MQETPLLIDRNIMVEEIIDENPKVPELLQETQSEAEKIIEQAQVTAEQYLNAARQQAEVIKQQAYEESYQLGQEQGRQDGQQEGYQNGFSQGQQAGRAEMQQLIEQAIGNTQQLLRVTEEEIKEQLIAAEEQIVAIALAVARKIVAYEVSENPMVVLPLVKAALEKVSDQEEVVIRVSMDDFEAVLQAKKDLQTMVGKEHALKIIVDGTIDCGSCIIDTSYGTVDARIDTQFEIIKKALTGIA